MADGTAKTDGEFNRRNAKSAEKTNQAKISALFASLRLRMLDEVKTAALKRSIALQLQRIITDQHVSKTQLAARMNTSRAALDRLLNVKTASLTLATTEKAARALGHRLKIEFVSA